jgi:membrane dipeptidase
VRRIIDGHLDLGWSAAQLNRDLTESIATIRKREAGMTDTQSRGNATVSLPAMREGGVMLCLPTILARARRDVQAPLREMMDYGTPDIAYAAGMSHLAYYHALERAGHFKLIADRESLDQFWQANDPHLVGGILSMEGADPILDPAHAKHWFDHGLRVLSLVHYGHGPYAGGTSTDGRVTPDGIELLREMRRLGMILDVTHLSDPAFAQAMELFDGPVVATHSNCRALAPDQRQWSDEQLKVLFERNAVIGAVMDIWMCKPWPPGTFGTQGYMKDAAAAREQVSLDTLCDHIDHICQLAGNVNHVAIGSDLDGGFGTEQSPIDIDTIADLQKLDGLLSKRGYSSEDIDAIFHGNWLRFFREHLPG